MVTNGDCTVFNRVYNKEPRMDKWVATHLHGVLWEDCKASNTIKSGMTEADSVRVFLPFFVSADGKYFASPKVFAENPEGHFTLQAEDYLVRGIVGYEGNMAKLTEVFDHVVKITSVDTFDCGSPQMRHWEVSGK